MSPGGTAPSTVTRPSRVVTSNELAAASTMITSVKRIVDLFALTTLNVTVASVPSASGAAPSKELAAIVTLLSVVISGGVKAPAGK